MGLDGARLLANSLTSSLCSLEHLDVESTHNFGWKGVQAFANAINDPRCKLQSLALPRGGEEYEGHLFLTHWFDEDWFAKLFQSNLKALALSECDIAETGAKKIRELLLSTGKKECTLLHLDLCETRLENEGAQHIAEALKDKRCSLTSIDMKNNDIDEDGIKFILAAVQHVDCKIKKIDLLETRSVDDIDSCRVALEKASKCLLFCGATFKFDKNEDDNCEFSLKIDQRLTQEDIIQQPLMLHCPSPNCSYSTLQRLQMPYRTECTLCNDSVSKGDTIGGCYKCSYVSCIKCCKLKSIKQHIELSMLKNFSDQINVSSSDLNAARDHVKADIEESKQKRLGDHEHQCQALKNAIELKILKEEAESLSPPVTSDDVLELFGINPRFQKSKKKKIHTKEKEQAGETSTTSTDTDEKQRKLYDKKKASKLQSIDSWSRAIEIAKVKQTCLVDYGMTIQDVRKHGELKDKATWDQALGEATDNHHSPLTPSKYIKFRLRPALDYYRQKLPGYASSRALTQMLTILASLVGAGLSFLGMPLWVGVLSCSSAAVVAWSDFSGTDKKMER